MASAGLPLAPAAAAWVRRIVPGRNVRFVRWGFSHVLLALLVGVAAGALSLLVRPASKEGLEPLVEVVRSALVEGVVCLYLVAVARRVDPDGARALGFPAGWSPRALLAGLCAWLVLAPSLMGLAHAWPAALELLGEPRTEQPLLVALRGIAGSELLLVAAFAVLVVPFLEELVFRAFLQPLLVQNLDEASGVALTSLLFALLHGSAAFLPIFALSLLLGGLMLRTQRLSVVWLVHALNNALALLYVHLQAG